MKNYQIIIVGSGPAGISTALHLNLLRPSITEKILILEKTKHPREKICAGGIVGNAQNELNNMNISFSDMNISKVTTDILRFHLGDEWNDTYESGFTSVVRRNEFDAQLVNIARERGISINENEKVIDIERTDDGIKVITEKDTYLAQILIGADGVGSIVRQKFCGKASEYEFSRLHLIETPVKEEETAEFQNGAIGFDMSYVPLGLQGYVWDFPCYIDGKPFLSRGIVDHNPNISERVDIIAIFREALKKRGVTKFVVISRTISSACGLAEKWNGRADSFEDLTGALEATDVLISSTSAPHTLIHRGMIEKVMSTRKERPMVIIDIAVPRDVASDVAEIENVKLYDIDTLNQNIEVAIESREREIPKVERIIDYEYQEYKNFYSSLRYIPVIAGMRQHADNIAQKELEKTLKKMHNLDPKNQEQIKALTHSIVQKILHEPTIKLREEAKGPNGEKYAFAVSELFGLNNNNGK